MAKTPETAMEWHALFYALTDLTADAEGMNAVADRLRKQFPQHSEEDHWYAMTELQNKLDQFCEEMSEMFFRPEQHGWSEKEIKAYRGELN